MYRLIGGGYDGNEGPNVSIFFMNGTSKKLKGDWNGMGGTLILVKMPGKAVHRQNKPQGKYGNAANSANDRAILKIMEGQVGEFGRVKKNIGPYFLVHYYDGKESYEITAEPRGVFNARGKVRVHISTGDIVLLEGVKNAVDSKRRGKNLVVEITGKFNKKEAQSLYTNGRLHRSILMDSDENENDIAFEDIFDYSDETGEESMKKQTGKGSGARSGEKVKEGVKQRVNSILNDTYESEAIANDLHLDTSTTHKPYRPSVAKKLLPEQSFHTSKQLPAATEQKASWSDDLYEADDQSRSVPDTWEDEIDIDAI